MGIHQDTARLLQLRKYIDTVSPNASSCVPEGTDPSDTVNLCVWLLDTQRDQVIESMDREYDAEANSEKALAAKDAELAMQIGVLTERLRQSQESHLKTIRKLEGE